MIAPQVDNGGVLEIASEIGVSSVTRRHFAGHHMRRAEFPTRKVLGLIQLLDAL